MTTWLTSANEMWAEVPSNFRLGPQKPPFFFSFLHTWQSWEPHWDDVRSTRCKDTGSLNHNWWLAASRSGMPSEQENKFLSCYNLKDSNKILDDINHCFFALGLTILYEQICADIHLRVRRSRRDQNKVTWMNFFFSFYNCNTYYFVHFSML